MAGGWGWEGTLGSNRRGSEDEQLCMYLCVYACMLEYEILKRLEVVGKREERR